MSVAAACFKWADVLENQFDKSWVELDTILCQLEDDEVRKILQNYLRHLFSLRILGFSTCRGEEQPPPLPPASPSLLTSQPQSSRFSITFFLIRSSISVLRQMRRWRRSCCTCGRSWRRLAA